MEFYCHNEANFDMYWKDVGNPYSTIVVSLAFDEDQNVDPISHKITLHTFQIIVKYLDSSSY